MKKLILILIFISSLFSKMHFANPKPTFDNPRLWLVTIRVKDKHIVNHILNGINNVMKEYPQEALKVAVVFYGPGMRVIKKDYDKKILSRITSLMEYDVEMIGCLNTMKTMKWKKSDFIDDIEYVQAGIAEVIERKQAGWIEFTPY